MLDSHAHIGYSEYKDALVCSSNIDEIPSGYRFNSIGLLPENSSYDLEYIEKYLSAGFFLGEVGLDKRYPDIDKQIAFFTKSLSLAKEYNRFVTIHMVGYQEVTYNIIREAKITNFMLHGYTGSVEMAKRFISLGGLISLSPRAEKAKSFNSLIQLPFITETDMKMGKDERIVLTMWNNKLSTLLDRDISSESEKRLLERLI